MKIHEFKDVTWAITRVLIGQLGSAICQVNVVGRSVLISKLYFSACVAVFRGSYFIKAIGKIFPVFACKHGKRFLLLKYMYVNIFLGIHVNSFLGIKIFDGLYFRIL